MSAQPVHDTETPGIGGHNAAGILGETPELVNYDRSKGYPWEPWAAMPQRWIPGASSIGKAVGSDWSWWARRVAARVAARMRKDLAEITNAKTAESELYKAANDEQRIPMDDGSDVHLFTALEDAGRPQTVDLPDRLMGHVQAWRMFKEHYQIRIGAIERTGYATEFGYGAAGTIDRVIVCERHDELSPTDLVVVDLKTKGQPLAKLKPSLEHLVQIVALSRSTHLAIEEARTLVALPPVVRGAIVYLARDGYRVHWVDPQQADVAELTLACIAAAALKRRIGNGAFGKPSVAYLPVDVPGVTVLEPPQMSSSSTDGKASNS